MNKNTLCLTSLVAALPGAWLAVLMVMAFINFAGGWSAPLKGIAGLLLLAGAALAAMPVGIFLFFGPKTAKPLKATEATEKEPGESESSAAVEADASVADDASTFEIDESSENVEEAADEFDLGGDFESDDDVETKSKK